MDTATRSSITYLYKELSEYNLIAFHISNLSFSSPYCTLLRTPSHIIGIT